MNGAYMMTGLPWGKFEKFIAPDADRFGLLKELLEEAKLDFKVVTLAGRRHFFITPPQPEKDFLRRHLTVLIAHYDRAPGSPGANDNSAGVFLLIQTALKLRAGKVFNWLIVFTDKEELGSGESILNQGAYTLASGFKDAGLEGAHIYSFDACGTGDTLIISTTAELLLKGNGSSQGTEKIRQSVQELRQRALETARNLGMQKVLLVPTPFSDDAGFFRAGLAAQTITMLPSEECRRLVSVLRKNPLFADALISREVQSTQDKRLIPETWRSLNGPGDCRVRLTPRHFPLVLSFARDLCRG
jgi:hypothetical protein